MRRLSILMALSILTGAAGCGGGDDPSPPTPPVETETFTFNGPNVDVSILAQKSVVPAGGITIANVDMMTQQTVQNDAQMINPAFEQVAVGLDLGPDGSTFNPPLEVTLTFDAPQVASGARAVTAVTPTMGGFDSFPIASLDVLTTGEVEVVVSVDHFSVLVLLILSAPDFNIVPAMSNFRGEVDQDFSVTSTPSSSMSGGYGVDTNTGETGTLQIKPGPGGTCFSEDFEGYNINSAVTNTPTCKELCQGEPIWYEASMRLGPSFANVDAFQSGPLGATAECQYFFTLPGMVDPSSTAGQIDVAMLNVQGTDFPLYQFFEGGPEPINPPCGCPGDHYHAIFSDLLAFAYEPAPPYNASIMDTENCACGFGQSSMFSTSVVTIPYDNWRDFGLFRPHPSMVLPP